MRHRPSVVPIPVKDDGQIVLIRQYRHALKRDIWELPAGSVDEGETAEAAAARECEEEIGQVPMEIERLGFFCPTPGYDEEMILFARQDYVRHRRTRSISLTKTRTSPLRPMSAAEAKAMVARGEIIDLKTAYALTLI